MGFLLLLLVFLGIATVIPALRSRARVRKLLEEPAAPPAIQCASRRPGVQRFFEETHLMKSEVEARLRDGGDASDFVHRDVDPAAWSNEHARRVSDWLDLYSTQLDDADREELQASGVDAAVLQRMAHGAHLTDPMGLQRFLADVHAVEVRLASPMPNTVYR